MISTFIFTCKTKENKRLFKTYYGIYNIETVTERSNSQIVSTPKFHAHETAEEKEQQQRDLFRILPDEVIQGIIKCYGRSV